MSYLLDKNKRTKKIQTIAMVVVVVLFLFYFRASVYHGLSVVTHAVFKPVISFGQSIGSEFSAIGTAFRSKQALVIENKNLKSQIADSVADRANYAGVVDENNKMKEILGNKSEKMNLVLAGIISKPNHSVYDTLIIDVGSTKGIQKGQRIFAYGSVPIGRIAEVYARSANVVLFSNPGEITDVIIAGSNIFLQAIGRGGGNFELDLPRDAAITVDAEVDLPGINNYILGTVATIVSDPRDSFQKAIVVSPVNIQQLKFVEVEI